MFFVYIYAYVCLFHCPLKAAGVLLLDVKLQLGIPFDVMTKGHRRRGVCVGVWSSVCGRPCLRGFSFSDVFSYTTSLVRKTILQQFCKVAVDRNHGDNTPPSFLKLSNSNTAILNCKCKLLFNEVTGFILLHCWREQESLHCCCFNCCEYDA